MKKIEELIKSRLEMVLDKALTDIIDRALVEVVDRVIARALGAELELAPAPAPAESKALEAEAEVTAPAPAESKALEAEAEVTAPAPTAESKAEDQLMTRLERVASVLGEKYGPMLLRRARSLSRHAINPKGALAVITAWAERAPAGEIIATLRGSDRLSDGTTLSGWRLMAYRLGIPLKE